MSTEQTGDRIQDTYQPPRVTHHMPTDEVISHTAIAPQVESRNLPNRVQWGPILGGVVTTFATLLLLTALGLAIGASAFEPGTDLTEWGTGAGIYGILSAIAAFFLGGWVAAKTSATGGSFSGLMNGFVAGAVALLALVWFSTSGLTNLFGFVGANLANISDAVSGVPTGEVESAAAEAVATSPITFADVEKGAWMTFIALSILLGSAALGGRMGRNDRHDVTDTVVR